MKEKAIVNGILDELRLRGPKIWFRKNHGGPFGISGVPDIEVVFRPRRMLGSSRTGTIFSDPDESLPGIVVFIEVKKPGEEPTRLQVATMKRLRAAGSFVFLAFSKNEAIEFLDRIGLPPREPTREENDRP